MRPDIGQYLRLRLRCRMDAIGLEQVELIGEAGEQERNQCNRFFPRELRVNGDQALRVVAAVVGRDLNANQQHACARAATGANHRAQVLAQRRQRQSAQSVVGSQFDHHHSRLILTQQRRQTRAAAARCLAADAGVDDAILRYRWRCICCLRRLRISPRFFGQAVSEQFDPAGVSCQSVFADRLSPTISTTRRADLDQTGA